MKTSPLFLTLFALSASADPFVPVKGDFAVYDCKSNDSAYQSKSSLRSIDHRAPGITTYGFDNYRDGPDGDWIDVGPSRRSDPDVIRSYFSDVRAACPGLNGAVEIVHVPAGPFQTCKVTANVNGEYSVTSYYAAGVPFGVVKQVWTKFSDPSSPLTIELTSFGREQ